MSKSYAKIRHEKTSIPTYGVGTPDKNPMFLEKRVYQGSSGRVYPYPVIDKILDEKKDVEYDAIILENEYLYVMVLPQLGGRIQRACDKTNGYDFVYHNEVIKPALVGLLGPWISGGIEFNWPQHHRPTTYMPTSWRIEHGEDGSVTLAVGDVDEMYGSRVVTRFTLYPGRAWIEIEAQLYNRTPFSQTFLWWANPAVPVNDDTQSVFPPDVTAVFDHGKRDVSSFPIARGVYYKHDYSAGVDISRYKNIPVPTSYMAYKSVYDFVGGYDYGKEAGILHIADHHISPGKKQWTWGCGDFGQAWDRNLTDANGPYIELMTGVYTDNQPDFTYLAPYEEKSFKQYFMPYKKAGYVKDANLDLIVNLSCAEGRATAVVYPTQAFDDVRITVLGQDGRTYIDEVTSLTVEEGWQKSVDCLLPETKLTLTVTDETGEVLIKCSPIERKEEALPDPAASLPAPGDVPSVEELVLAAQHLEQYRHATLESEPYYEEALKRDPYDSRANLFYGELMMRRCRFKEAEEHLRRSIKRQTWLTPNPYDSQAYTSLAQLLFYEGRLDDAYDAWYKAAWSEREGSRAWYGLACVAAIKGEYEKALDFVDRAISHNDGNVKALGLYARVLESLGYEDEADAVIEDILGKDPFDIPSLFYSDPDSLKTSVAQRLVNWTYPALDLVSWGCLDEALALLETCPIDSPMKYYYEAWIHHLAGDEEERGVALDMAADADETWCFPNTVEDYIVLTSALEANPDDITASYLLGNLQYDKKNYQEAYEAWMKGRGKNPTVLRNLAIVLYNKMDRREEALSSLKAAYEADPSDARVLLELVQLEEKLKVSMAERMRLLEEHRGVMEKRDDLFTIYISFLNRSGRHEEALQLLSSRIFHPWEGGEGKVTKEYVTAHKDLGIKAWKAGDTAVALSHLDAAMSYPHNLGEGKLEGCKDNEIHYLKGCVLESAGDKAGAEKEYILALEGKAELSGAKYYYDQSADVLFFQALAKAALGRTDEATSIFSSIVEYAEDHKEDIVGFDYFAVSLPDLQMWTDDLTVKNRAHCFYLKALGLEGLGRKAEAGMAFAEALRINPDLVDAERLEKVLTQLS